MKLLNCIILPALLCVCGVAGAQELKWSDFTVSDTIGRPTKMLFDWDAKRTSVTKNDTKYKYLDIQSRMISAQVRPGCQTSEELSHCQTLADYSKAWALALQDSLLSVTKNSNQVAALFKERYLSGLKEGEKTGIYQFPLQPDTPFDITSINFKEAKNGAVLGVGVTAAMPLGDFGKLVAPIAGLNLSIGEVLNKSAIDLDVFVGTGNVKDLYLDVYGPRRKKQILYLNLSANYYQPLLRNGKDRLLACAGAGYSMTQFSRYYKNYFLKVPVGGLSLSAGMAYDHKLGVTTYNLEGNHSEMQNNYLRFRLYTDQILTKTAWMPTVNASVSFIILGRNLSRGD